jgi:hypothetical protein
MRLFVALGIVVVTLLLLAAKLTRHHRRVGPPGAPQEAEAEPRPAPPADRTSPPARPAWSGPTLRDLLEKPQATATIRGHARGPEGVAIGVRASLAGKRERGRRIRIEDGAFEIPGLLFGRSYDLTFDGANLRPTTLRSVIAPADDVEAKLELLPVLRGAIGFPAGGACDYRQVALRTDGVEARQLVAVGLDEGCRFDLTVPDGPSQMAIPPLGDPEPVCLNPPCQADPLAGMARLRIAFLGADHTDVSATLTFAGEDRSSSYTCFTNGEACELDALPINQAFTLSAEATDCATATRTITLHAGDNDASLPCEIGLGDLGDEVPNEVPGEIQIEDEIVVE